jgi:hypothetical protein
MREATGTTRILTIGDACSDAFLLNNRGQVIGPSYESCDFQIVRGYLWDNGVIIDLNAFVPPDSALQLADPLFINDRGVIVVSGFLPNGNEHAVVLLPCDDDEMNGCTDSSSRSSASQLTRSASAMTALHHVSPAEAFARIRSQQLSPRHIAKPWTHRE